MSYSVSIIINCYNGEKYLEECLKSLQNQIFQDFEVIFGTTVQAIKVQKFLKNTKVRNLDILNQKIFKII